MSYLKFGIGSTGSSAGAAPATPAASPAPAIPPNHFLLLKRIVPSFSPWDRLSACGRISSGRRVEDPPHNFPLAGSLEKYSTRGHRAVLTHLLTPALFQENIVMDINRFTEKLQEAIRTAQNLATRYG